MNILIGSWHQELREITATVRCYRNRAKSLRKAIDAARTEEAEAAGAKNTRMAGRTH